jgi:hypothetical protein
LTFLLLGSTVAQYTGQTLHHRVLASPYFEKKEYSKALVESFLLLDKELLEGKMIQFFFVKVFNTHT